jgi:hypothetical protein
MPKKITEREIEIVRHAISQSPMSMLQAARLAKLPYGTFIYRAQKIGIYDPNPTPKGKVNISEARRNYIKSKTLSLEKILNGDYPNYPGRMLKHRLYESGLKEERCEECGQGNMWNDKPLVLELEHISGNKTDHRWENLKILCLHCHSQTTTYKRKKSALLNISK